MRQDMSSTVPFRRRLLLVAARTTTIAALTAGLVHAPRVEARAQVSVQGEDPNRPAFDVTSVKPNRTTAPRVMVSVRPDGVWEGSNVTLGMLIRMAYQIQDSQVIGGPAWMYTDRFDVLGKRPEGGAPAQQQAQLAAMMQSLLIDRFKLATHRDTRELPIYALVLARRDGRLGPGLKPAAVDCAAIGPRGRGIGPVPPGDAGRGGLRGGSSPVPVPVPQPGERPPCGMFGGNGTFSAGGLTIAQLATRLSQDVGRVVVDRTGLTGSFDLDLTYAPEAGGRRDLPPPGAADRPADPDVPSLFTAIEEQLGLKLESQRAPVDVLVIDHAEVPTDN